MSPLWEKALFLSAQKWPPEIYLNLNIYWPEILAPGLKLIFTPYFLTFIIWTSRYQVSNPPRGKLFSVGQDRTGQERTKLPFKLDFPSNLWLAAFTMFKPREPHHQQQPMLSLSGPWSMGYMVYSKAPNEGKLQWYHLLWLINNAFSYTYLPNVSGRWPWLNLLDLMYFYFCMFSLFLWCAGRKSGTSGKVCGEGKYYFGSGESFQHSICPETSSFCDKQDKTLLMFF